jgi:hypothetical protein
MEFWKTPHISKVYEALTAIADDRFKMIDDNKAHCYSSSGNKYYEIEFSPTEMAIMSNDNTAWFTDCVSYPMIGYLMLTGLLKYNPEVLPLLKGIKWKDINQKFKNNYDKAIEFVLENLKEQGIDIKFIEIEIAQIYKTLLKIKLGKLGAKRFPPKGY